MLNDEKRKIIEDNIALVHSYLNRHNILDEDERADYVCEFCSIMNKCEYDESLAKLSTLVWRSLDNYRLRKLKHKTATKRKLNEGECLMSLDEKTLNGTNEEMLERSELVPCKKNTMYDFEVEDFIKQARDYIVANDTTTKHKREQIFDKMIEAYRHNNGFFNSSDFARECNISRQAIHTQLKIVREQVRELLWKLD